MGYDFSTAKIEVKFTCSCGKVVYLTGCFPTGEAGSFTVTSNELFGDIAMTEADILALAEACNIMLDKLPDLPDD